MISGKEYRRNRVYLERAYSLGRMAIVNSNIRSYYYGELKSLLRWARRHESEALANELSKAALNGKRKGQEELAELNRMRVSGRLHSPWSSRDRSLTRKRRRKSYAKRSRRR